MTFRTLPSKRKTTALVSMLGLLAFACVPHAWAVDIENAERKPQEVTVNRADGSSETLTLAAGQRLENICADCVVLVGDNSVEPRGEVTVRIRDGKLSVTPSR